VWVEIETSTVKVDGDLEVLWIPEAARGLLDPERRHHERCVAWRRPWRGRGERDIKALERNRFAVKGGESSRLEVKAPVSASVPYQ